MNKSDIIKNIARKMDITYQQADKAVDAFFTAIAEGLGNNKRVELRGFGSFDVRAYDAYIGRNPRTGEDVPVPPKFLPRFKAGKDVKNIINK